MTTIDDLLTAIFYRLSCPEPEKLGDYHLRRLSPGERLVVARHLRDCPHCARELEMYASPDEGAEGVLNGVLSPVEGLSKDRLRGLISRVLWATPSVSDRLAPALRGGPYAQRLYQAEGVQIELQVQPATSGYRRQRLLGQVQPISIVTEVELWHESEVLESSAVDDEGYFSFDRLKPGAYTLCLRGDGMEIWQEVIM